MKERRVQASNCIGENTRERSIESKQADNKKVRKPKTTKNLVKET